MTKVLHQLTVPLSRDHVGKGEESHKKQEKAHRRFLRTENVIVEWQQAEEKLATLRQASEQEDRLQVRAGFCAY